MACCAVYRLPNEDVCTLMIQSGDIPRQFDTCDGLSGQSGFVISPFAVGADTPVLMLCPDIKETYGCVDIVPQDMRDKVDRICSAHSDVSSGCLSDVSFCHGMSDGDTSSFSKETYSEDFSKYHGRLLDGSFSKIVLARCAVDTVPNNVSPFMLFTRACMRYPRMFVALFSTPQSGTWLMATPEVLLENTADGRWHTMALAGTMKLEGNSLRFDVPVGNGGCGMDADELPAWNDKNIQEQRYVATYIKQCIGHFTDDITEDGPYTKRAGNVVHLRSDFSFSLADDVPIGRLLGRLHPTPAVCGLPKDSTFGFIVANEHCPREYYSGFAGPLDIAGSTHLYVSLRCMRIDGGCRYRLYAGGGLLRDSVEELEWKETEAKMETMRQILNDINYEL